MRWNGLVGEVLVHSYGTSSEVPVGQVPRYWMEEELHSVGKVHDLCRGYESIRIAESTVLDTVRTRSHYGST